MGKINVGRWLAGGVVAGVLVDISETVLNTVVLGKQWESAMKALGKTMAPTSSAMAVWMIWGMIYGLVAVWVYAAIRPRFGAGVGTAARAGLIVWIAGNLLPAVSLGNMDLAPTNLLVISAVWGLVEMVLATILGAWVYREGPAGSGAAG